MLRDRELNNFTYPVLRHAENVEHAFVDTKSADLKVGSIVKLTQGQRVPADLILLYTTEKNGSVFIKTD